MRTSRCILVAAILACAGCAGYSTESLIDPKYKTVYVQTFDNRSFYRGFEQSLTRELINKINSRTTLRIAPKDRADTIITGLISSFQQYVLTEDANDNVRELQVTLTVDMTWTDRRTGRPIAAVRNMAVSDQIKFDIGQTLDSTTPKLFQDAAERLVDHLEKPW